MKSGENGLIGPGDNNYGRDNASTMKPAIILPTCGRIVHYHPVLPDAIAERNPDYCKVFPAIVVEATDLYANIVTFNIGSHPAEAMFSIPHRSEVARREDGNPAMSFWDWPAR